MDRRTTSQSRDVGVRELKIRASEIVRAVRRSGARYTITYRGRPVGVLLAVDEAGPAGAKGDASARAWDDLMRLGARIGRGWRGRRASTRILSDMRR